MKAESEGRRQNEECRSGEKLGSGIRAQPLGCRGLRQLWRNRERRQIVESAVTVRREPRRTGFEFRCPRQTVYGGWLGNLVEREGVIKFLTVRSLMSPGGCRKASVHAAAFSHLCHVEPSSGWFVHRRGEETAPCMGCLRRLPPEGGVPGSREETAPCLAVRAREAGARAGLASAGGSADAPACGQAVGANLARTNLDLGRARWVRGSSKRMNGIAKGLRACFKISRGPVFGQKAGWRGAAREALRTATTEQLRRHSRAGRSQAAFCPKTLRAAGLWPVAGVGSFLTARCGRCARPRPPGPRPKSLAAGLLLILKQALSDRNTCFIYGEDERGLGLEENVRLNSLMFAYVRLLGKKMLEAAVLISGVWSLGPGGPRRRRARTSYRQGVSMAGSADFRAYGFAVLAGPVSRIGVGTGKPPKPLECLRYGAKQVRCARRRQAASWSLGPG